MINALCGQVGEQFLPLAGRVLCAIETNEKKEVLTFRFEDGEVKYEAYGDCCSSTWIEHIELPKDLTGAKITGVTENPVLDATKDDEKNPKAPEEWDESRREHECLQVYQTIFHTTCGDISVEYRNSSNGYYGGSLELRPFCCVVCGQEIGKYTTREHMNCFRHLTGETE